MIRTLDGAILRSDCGTEARTELDAGHRKEKKKEKKKEEEKKKKERVCTSRVLLDEG